MALIDDILLKYNKEYEARQSYLMLGLAKQWLQVENNIKFEMDDLLRVLDAKRQAGQTITQQMLWKEEYYRRLLLQADDQIKQFNAYAINGIYNAQENAYLLGAEVANNTLYSTYAQIGALAPFWEKADVGGVKNMYNALTGTGSPLKDLLEKDYIASMGGLTNALVEGMARGFTTQQIALNMANASSMGLNRAQLIANTEVARAYTTGTIDQYYKSGMVEYYLRYVNKNHACPACLALDGEEFYSKSAFYDHPNGACNVIAKVKGIPVHKWEKGEDWLKNQPEVTQRKILGNTRYDLWKNVGISLKDMTTVVKNDVWGKSPGVKSLKDLRASRPPIHSPVKVPEILQPTPVKAVIPDINEYMLDPDYQSFLRYSEKWTSGIDYNARAIAYDMARRNENLRTGMLREIYKGEVPSQVVLYRVGNIAEEGVSSFFTKLSQAEAYQRRMGVERIQQFIVPSKYVVSSGSGAGEVWIDVRYLDY